MSLLFSAMHPCFFREETHWYHTTVADVLDVNKKITVVQWFSLYNLYVTLISGQFRNTISFLKIPKLPINKITR